MSTSSSFFQKFQKKFPFSSDSSKTADLLAFRSQFHHKEKDSRFDSDVTLDGEKTPDLYTSRTQNQDQSSKGLCRLEQNKYIERTQNKWNVRTQCKKGGDQRERRRIKKHVRPKKNNNEFT